MILDVNVADKFQKCFKAWTGQMMHGELSQFCNVSRPIVNRGRKYRLSATSSPNVYKNPVSNMNNTRRLCLNLLKLVILR